MNTLGYQMLGILIRQPSTGYDITKALEYVRPAKLSQIYPLLGQLEKKGLVTYTEVEQTGRPDKKIYSVTEKGRETLLKWIGQTPSEPVVRDEFLTMVYSIWLKDKDTGIKFFNERLESLEKKMAYREKQIKELEEEHAEEINDITNWQFSRYILLQRRFLLQQVEVDWCRRVLDIYNG